LIAIASATLESNPRALKEEYELAGLFHLGLVGLAVGLFSGASESDQAKCHIRKIISCERI